MHTGSRRTQTTDLSAILEGLLKADIRFILIKMLAELKKASGYPKDKQRLPVLEETLRQLKKTSDNDIK